MTLLTHWPTGLNQKKKKQITSQKRQSKKQDLIPIRQEILPGLAKQPHDCQGKPYEAGIGRYRLFLPLKHHDKKEILLSRKTLPFPYFCAIYLFHNPG